MKTMLIYIARILGVALMILAFLQWVTFEYPNVNPLWPGAILAPGMLAQVVNWLIVCVIGAAGWGLFSMGRTTKEQGN